MALPQIKLLDAVTGTGAGSSNPAVNANRRYECIMSGGTSPTATVLVEVSDDNTNWMTLATFTMSSTTTVDGFATAAGWAYHRGNVTAISGSPSITLLCTFGA